MATASSKQGMNPGLKKAAYISALVGGGVVGVDYATWWNLSPGIGAVIGSVLSLLLTHGLIYLKEDPEREIEKFFAGVGAIAGGIAGIGIGVSEFDSCGGILGGLIIGGLVGAGIGQLVAGLISLSALALLFISRGPVGLYLRNVVLKGDDDVGLFPEHFEPVSEFVALLAIWMT